jgi:methylphosphotriester-DNA--protein-cysteine methyltransferase
MNGFSESPAGAPWTPRELSSSEAQKVACAVCVTDELDACTETDVMLRLAVERARERLALERVALYIRHQRADGVFFRGTWGTGAHGETTDERSLCHQLSTVDQDGLLHAHLAGELGAYQDRAPLFASDSGRPCVIGEGWVMATPLVAAGALIGIMYNDTALTHTPVDEEKQRAAAVFCTLLATLLTIRESKRAGLALPAKPINNALVRRALSALEDDLSISGERLARELGVSAGHLARSFKREMAMSLVDYRNRVRMARFFEAIQGEGDCRTLHGAARAAGFGSYAQFHRTYRKFHGAPPRDALSINAR